MAITIDAHHHFWKTEDQTQPWREPLHSALENDFGADDLQGQLRQSGIDGTVLIQSVNEPAENDRLREYEKNDFVLGVVAWLPLNDAAAAQRELNRMDLSKVCGVRTIVANDPLNWIIDKATISVFRDLARRRLVWDVVPITSQQVANVLKLADIIPELKIVIDHLGRPPLDSDRWEPWAGQLKNLAGCPNVAAKVSVGIDVLSKWETWRCSDLLPYVQWACQHFGPSRLMLASNWPVVLLKSSYQGAWRDLVLTVETVLPNQADLDHVKGGTAQRWYALDHQR